MTGSADWYAHPGARSWRCPPLPGQTLRFHTSLPGYQPTALVPLPQLAAEFAVGQVWVKDESSRFGLPAFKALGASWATLRRLAEHLGGEPAANLDDLRQRLAGLPPVELVTATDGNHGRAVARMARLVGARAHIFVPLVVPLAARSAIAGEGAEVTVVDGSYDEAVRCAASYAHADQARFLIQDTAWPGYERVPGWIVEGYATLVVEVDRQLAEAGTGPASLIVVPVGVGSLAQAVLAHYRSQPEPPAVLSVEPTTAACVLASLTAGEPVPVPTGATIMAGLNCGTPSSIAWPYLRDGLDAAVAVSDAEAARAVADLAAAGVAAGPCGAASLAGARAVLTRPERRTALGVDESTVVVLLNTEGAAANRPE